MKITKEGRFSIRGVIDIAMHSVNNKPVKVDEMSQRMKVSRVFLNKIMNKLHKSNIIGSLRGRYGGYMLLKEPNELSVYEGLKASGEKLSPVVCVESTNADLDECELMPECLVLPIWKILGTSIEKVLSSITIEDVMNGDSEKVLYKYNLL